MVRGVVRGLVVVVGGVVVVVVVVVGGLVVVVVVDLDNKLLNLVLVCNLFHHGNLVVVEGDKVVVDHC